MQRGVCRSFSLHPLSLSLHRTLEELAKEQKKKASKRHDDDDDEGDFTGHRDSAASLLEFLEKARSGAMIPSDVIYRYANYFQDDLTLDNMPRMQLINLCRYMGIQPYGSDSFLRFQLRHKIRTIKEDDGRILWEGIEALDKMELREACQERGMRSTGLSKEAYRTALKEWLDLSVNKDVPIALLIMSRTFFLRKDVFQSESEASSSTVSSLTDAISGLDKEIVNEAILEVATQDEKRSDPEVQKIKLEVLSQQNELIREEQEAREAATAKKLREEEEASTKEAVDVAIEAPDINKEELVESNITEETRETTSVKETEVAIASDKTHWASPVASTEDEPAPTVTDKIDEKSDEAGTLSPEEMDAISQLVTDDPVSKERADLERIKAAMNEDSKEEAAVVSSEEPTQKAATEKVEAEPDPELIAPTASVNGDEDKVAKQEIETLDNKVSKEAAEATVVTLDDHLAKEDTSGSPDPVDEEESDPVVTRLKKRVKSMVDKIEVQLTETQVKIGDKLHFLDKDKDGIFSMDEMAEALQTVLKRKISFEEAVEIAKDMVRWRPHSRNHRSHNFPAGHQRGRAHHG